MTLPAWSRLCLAAALLLGMPAGARADADADWRQIEAMDSRAPSGQWTTREEARTGTIEYLGQQERALRGFIATYPADPRQPEAKLRLAHLLATRGDLEMDPRDRRKADAVLDELEREPAMKGRRADVEFARISIFMQRVGAAADGSRDALLEKARAFVKAFPDDRRVAPLLAEVADAFDDQPKTARALLEQARPVAKTAQLQARIDDDLKRLDLLGKPLRMRWTSVQGTPVDLDQMRGKVVLIYFFASWSPPSMAELDWVKQLAANHDSEQVLGISLDNDPPGLPAALADRGVAFPVYCDGQGWQGALVRSLGINALPELWIVDHNGILVSLDAKQDASAVIDRAAGEPGQ